ncbi:MAG: hypothetical protein MZV64_32745 [Ignavibacteriales bacterium]|nr:hypothetical protein [Ignavibacteriales bacterium]
MLQKKLTGHPLRPDPGEGRGPDRPGRQDHQEPPDLRPQPVGRLLPPRRPQAEPRGDPVPHRLQAEEHEHPPGPRA